MRIQIIGYSGAGKSTLADILAKYYHLPHLHMDTTQFYGEMKTRSRGEQERIINEFLDKNDNWIIDGNYYGIAKERFEICDEIYFLDFNRFFCLKEAMIRFIKNYNRIRESLGAIEKFDLSFIMWILKDGRTIEYQKAHLEHLNMAKIKHHFKRRKELMKYLKDNKTT